MKDAAVLVTGGAGNLGRAVSRAFLERGARVAIPFYKTDQVSTLDPLRGEFGDRVNLFALDLTTERGAKQAIQQTIEWAGRLDAVAHLVGAYAGGSRIADTPLDVWEAMIELNVKSAWLVARFAIPELLKNGGGSLVFVSSRAAVDQRRNQAAYAISKSALITLAQAIAEEYRKDGIRANAVMPGTIDTPANRRAMPDADHSTWTPPEQIARTILFLASPDAAAINGAAVPVYGLS